MKRSTLLFDATNDRRSFLKTLIVTLAGMLVACTPKIPGAKPILSTQLPVTPEPSTVSPLPSRAATASSLPASSDSPSIAASPTAAGLEAASPSPTACPPNVVCDQAALSSNFQNIDRTYSSHWQARNPGPAHIITSLCLRDGSCMMVCPVECIVPGKPQSLWPRTYIDPETCIDCGACIPECPHAAIFPEDEVPARYVARGGEAINRVGICGHYEGVDHHGETIVLDTVCRLTEGQVVDLTLDIQDNYNFFANGPGYEALNG